MREVDAGAERGFVLGLHVAQHAFGVEHEPLDDTMDSVFDVVEEIARGELTLVKTDAEAECEFADAPEELRASLTTRLARARRDQSETAKALVRIWSERPQLGEGE